MKIFIKKYKDSLCIKKHIKNRKTPGCFHSNSKEYQKAQESSRVLINFRKGNNKRQSNIKQKPNKHAYR